MLNEIFGLTNGIRVTITRLLANRIMITNLVINSELGELLLTKRTTMDRKWQCLEVDELLPVEYLIR